MYLRAALSYTAWIKSSALITMYDAENIQKRRARVFSDLITYENEKMQ